MADAVSAENDAVVISQPFVVGVGERVARALAGKRAHDDQRARVAHRQHAQQDGLHQAEDGRIGADSQRKREDDRRRQARAALQQPRPVADIPL